MYGNYTQTFDFFGTPKMRLFWGILDKVQSRYLNVTIAKGNFLFNFLLGRKICYEVMLIGSNSGKKKKTLLKKSIENNDLKNSVSFTCLITKFS